MVILGCLVASNGLTNIDMIWIVGDKQRVYQLSKLLFIQNNWYFLIGQWIAIVSQGSDRFKKLTIVQFNSQCHRPFSMNIFVFMYSLYWLYFVFLHNCNCILYFVILKSDHFIPATVQFNSQCRRPLPWIFYNASVNPALHYSSTRLICLDCLFVSFILFLYFGYFLERPKYFYTKEDSTLPLLQKYLSECLISDGSAISIV